MRKAKSQLATFAFALMLIAFALLCHFITRSVSDLPAFADKILNYSRVFIYIGIFSVWGVSVSRRVIEPAVRKILTSASVLMVFWLVVREYKYRFVVSADIIRFFWYCYYIPILLIPTLALFAALYTGKSEDFHLPKRSALLCVPSAFFVALVLTNDLHQQVFSFPSQASVWTEFNYNYSWGFYAIIIFGVIYTVASLIIMLEKTRIQKRTKYFIPLITPFVMAGIFTFLYKSENALISIILSDYAVFFCLVFILFFEICIRCGLIRSNSRYSELFSACVNTPVQILDNDYNVRFAASASESVALDDILRAKVSPVILESGKRLHTISVKGGYAIWTEDISELLNLRQTLTERKNELADRNAFLQLEYEKEKEHNIAKEQNRLYDLLQSKTQSQLDKIDSCVLAYKSAETEIEKKELLSKIVLFGTFIKRRKNFVLSMENSNELSVQLLDSALAESFRALKLCGINGGYYIGIDKTILSGQVLSLAYDFFEDVTEAVLDNAKFINFRFSEMGGALRISILSDSQLDCSWLREKYPDLKTDFDEGSEFVLTLNGGEKND